MYGTQARLHRELPAAEQLLLGFKTQTWRVLHDHQVLSVPTVLTHQIPPVSSHDAVFPNLFHSIENNNSWKTQWGKYIQGLLCPDAEDRGPGPPDPSSAFHWNLALSPEYSVLLSCALSAPGTCCPSTRTALHQFTVILQVTNSRTFASQKSP